MSDIAAECDICYRPTSGHRYTQADGCTKTLCRSCYDWVEFWESVSDDERAAEIAAMDSYAGGGI